MSDKKADSGLFGVNCEVLGCKYHEPGGVCCAHNITVQAPDASKKIETFCGTFTPDDGNFATGETSAPRGTSAWGGLSGSNGITGSAKTSTLGTASVGSTL